MLAHTLESESRTICSDGKILINGKKIINQRYYCDYYSDKPEDLEGD